ncbi:DNA-binding transcriptional regulator, PucR family [Alteribacillus persepolensis]|uniref:DNA-binding transcriptional regulator, PucR family n=1 Tax=Alteribacillus persepolensis TaxID=568899 RepID=A0A1G8IU75_9BACI|nr:helix-turn-helix domain-containing protein [Alteribacillus persepolensis]SDI22489.1 DNA-binding transcriptional regulator, PucR family [Alteribacillus persepolensis]
MTAHHTNQKLKQKIDEHLRNVTRQLITFDTLEETLNYLLESFYEEFTCDLVGVILRENDNLYPKAWIGEGFSIKDSLRLDTASCSANLLEDAIWWPNYKKDLDCAFSRALQQESLSTWFTVPLTNNNKSLGLCIIGFRNFTPLVLEAEKTFVEFGHDVAVALEMSREKENQKRKIKGIEWMKENIFLDSSIDQVIEKVVERAGKGTQSQGASIYLFDENNACFTYHPPSFGDTSLPREMKVNTNQALDNYFPFVEKTGEKELTVPLVVQLKTIGVLYVDKGENGVFSSEDLEFLNFVSAFVSMQMENARLYRFEIDSKKRLERIMEHHQELVKKTVEGESLETITETISSMLESSVLLLDRFVRPVTSFFKQGETHLADHYEETIGQKKQQITQQKSKEIWLEEEISCAVLPIAGASDVLGYVAVFIDRKKLDRMLRLTLDYAINVYAIEFIKQKLVVDTQEQVKESFVNQLFAESIVDLDKIIQYATLINWDVAKPHRIAVLSFDIKEEERASADLVMIESYKTWLWEQIKTGLSIYYSDIIFTRRGNECMFIVQADYENKGRSGFWTELYRRINSFVKKESPLTNVYLGVGGITEAIDDYYGCYMQAAKANNVVYHRFQEGGYAFYDELGSYTILHNTSDPLAAELFVKKHLGPLLKYSKNHQVDLFTTLRIFLNNNGNYRDASNQLYIHRSTLEYRMERVSELINVDLNSAEMRFELMMAYKLYRLFNMSVEQLI